MGLKDAETTVPVTPKGARCVVTLVRAALDPVDLETFDGWLSSPRESSWIAAAIRAHPCGIDLSEQTLRRHRRGECKCRR